jgi:hypothetical protein
MYVDIHSPAFAVALRIATERARAAYPEERATILRGAEIVRSGYVAMQDDGHNAHIRSATDTTRTYTVNGVCQCAGWGRAPGHRCSHRYAKSLYTKACAQLVTMWYAEYQARSGIAAQTKNGCWAFFPDASDEILVLPGDSATLIRFGQCNLTDAIA